MRCAAPTRDPRSGAADKGFAKRFSALCEVHIPSWAPRDRFTPSYRVAVNTRASDSGCGRINIGDEVNIIQP